MSVNHAPQHHTLWQRFSSMCYILIYFCPQLLDGGGGGGGGGGGDDAPQGPGSAVPSMCVILVKVVEEKNCALFPSRKIKVRKQETCHPHQEHGRIVLSLCVGHCQRSGSGKDPRSGHFESTLPITKSWWFQ